VKLLSSVTSLNQISFFLAKNLKNFLDTIAFKNRESSVLLSVICSIEDILDWRN